MHLTLFISCVVDTIDTLVTVNTVDTVDTLFRGHY